MSKRVLIVDDCPDVRAIFAQRFSHAGSQVVTVDDGSSAIEAVKTADEEHRPFHLIVLDIRMPGLNGMKTAQELRDAGFTGLIAACTAAATAEGRSESKQSGINFYFNKKVIKEELITSMLDQIHIEE